MKNEEEIITFTGNRGIKSKEVLGALCEINRKYPDAVWRSGMAYGLDMAVAEFAVANGIKFEAHLPFEPYIQCSKWNKTAQDLYFSTLEKASKVFTHGKGFSMKAYQDRNVAMARGADLVMAFNRNSRGGTVNMINHCKKSGITVIDGFSLFNEVV